jgi:hypothetical protein
MNFPRVFHRAYLPTVLIPRPPFAVQLAPFCTYGGVLDRQKLANELTAYYSHDLLVQLRYEVRTNGAEDWVNRFVHRKERAIHPFHHLLMLQFLGESVEGFFSASDYERPSPSKDSHSHIEIFRAAGVTVFPLGRRESICNVYVTRARKNIAVTDESLMDRWDSQVTPITRGKEKVMPQLIL